MACYLRYDCGCFFIHMDDDSIELGHACSDHRAQMATDAIANFSKRVKLGSSKVYN